MIDNDARMNEKCPNMKCLLKIKQVSYDVISNLYPDECFSGPLNCLVLRWPFLTPGTLSFRVLSAGFK